MEVVVVDSPVVVGRFTFVTSLTTMQYQIKVPFPSKLGARLEDRALASNSAKPVQDD